jgi:pyruvate/2-oxoglutarate dehydrogenase complex dihydrolipoamide dehydrogenase (E3) component
MPTKALLYAAEVKHLAERAETWGVRAGKVSFDFAKVMARKNLMIKDFADYRVQQLNAGNSNSSAPTQISRRAHG